MNQTELEAALRSYPHLRLSRPSVRCLCLPNTLSGPNHWRRAALKKGSSPVMRPFFSPFAGVFQSGASLEAENCALRH